MSEIPMNEVPMSEIPMSEIPMSEIPMSELPMSHTPLWCLDQPSDQSSEGMVLFFVRSLRIRSLCIISLCVLSLCSALSCEDARRVTLSQRVTESGYGLPDLTDDDSGEGASGGASESGGDSDLSGSDPNRETLSCEPPWDRLLPRRLRPLSREELHETWAALLSAGATDTLGDEETSTAEESMSCDLYSFEISERQIYTEIEPEREVRSVHIASELNGWAGTVSAGGWPLTMVLESDQDERRWELSRRLPIGQHLYKIVINESQWLYDPSNPQRQMDGYGGFNSVVSIRCNEGEQTNPAADLNPLTRSEARALIAEPISALPNHPRPRHFPFQAHSASMRLTENHISGLLELSKVMVDHLPAALPHLAPCLRERSFSRGVEEALSQVSESCLREVINAIGERLWRKPLSEMSKARWLSIAIESSPSVALRGMMLSPQSLHVSELGEEVEIDETLSAQLRVPMELEHPKLFALDHYERANVLAFSLWGAPPDDQLLRFAASGELARPEVMRSEAERLLDDKRAWTHWGRFAVQWLHLEDVGHQPKRADLFPTLNESVRHDLVEEARLSVADALLTEREGSMSALGPLSILFGRDRRDHHEPRWLSDDLIDYYQLRVSTEELEMSAAGVISTLSRYQVPTEAQGTHRARGGILGLGATLLSRAHSDQTSPILRGLFVRERLLCQTFGPPPPNAGGVPEVDSSATTRERFRQHSDDPGCRGCHTLIDDVGFGFEGFDAVGLTRESEGGLPIDRSGSLKGVERLGNASVSPFNGLGELGELLSQSPNVADCLITQLRRYTRGAMGVHRGLESTSALTDEERCHLTKLRDRFHEGELSLRSLLIELAIEPSYYYRRAFEELTDEEHQGG